ncbi:MAG TPA: hypothetical protein VJO99_16240 [Burkholderiaceae bacterium]|nr:hypothetical protein [Burkholderiaceae bacterium]
MPNNPTRPPCQRCGGTMLRGHALENTLSGSPDFPGGEVVTMSHTGPAQVVPVLKCIQCGYSVTA